MLLYQQNLHSTFSFPFWNLLGTNNWTETGRRAKMNLFLNFIVFFCVAAVVNTKYLHTKESYTEKTEGVQFQDFFNYDDNVYTEKSRYARHVELVTESVLEHLLKEINNKYPHSKNASQNSMPKMMKRLKMKLKRAMMKKKKLKKLSKTNSTMTRDETTVTFA